MSGSILATASPLAPLKFEHPRKILSSSPSWVLSCSPSSGPSNFSFKSSSFQTSIQVTDRRKTDSSKHICRAAEYKFPDPIPEFAEAETEKFRTHLINKLSQKDIYEDSVEEVADICTEILNHFLLTEYGGPGTLLVVPFIDMADTVHERGLPGASQAARIAVKWAQSHVDKDWKEWTGTD